MKNTTVLTVAAIFMAFLAHAQSTPPNPTRITYEYGDFNSGILQNYSQTYQYLNANGDIASDRQDKWMDDVWERDVRSQYTLNASGKPTLILREKIQPDGSWVLHNRSVRMYNANDNLISDQTDVWNTKSNSWSPDHAFTYEYTASGKNSEFRFKRIMNGVLSDEIVSNQYYDSSERLDSTRFMSRYNSSNTLQNESAEKFMYKNSSPDPQTSIAYTWDASLNTWAINTHSAYTETATSTGKQIVQLTHYMVDNVMILKERTTSDFDFNHQNTKRLTESWNGAFWKPFYLYEAIYNPDGSENQVVYSDYDEDQDMFNITSRFTYEYTSFVATHSPAFAPIIQVFPNPSSDRVQIMFEGAETGKPSDIQLIDAQGKLVAQTQAFGLLAVLSMKEQVAGTYFLRVQRDGATTVRMLVKE